MSDNTFTHEVVKSDSDRWTFTIDGEYLAVRRDRDYGSGPARYLWSAFEVDDVPDSGKVAIVRNLGTFHHSSRGLTNRLANDTLGMFRDAVRMEVAG